jgi:hypothetical protein
MISIPTETAFIDLFHSYSPAPACHVIAFKGAN